MSKQEKKAKKQPRVRGFYFAMIIWLIASNFMPMYRISGILGCAAITAALSVILCKVFKGKQVEDEEPEIEFTPKKEPEQQKFKQPEKSYGPEIDSIIADGNRAMSEMGRLYASIENPEIKNKINELMRVSDKIVQDAIHDPSDVPQIRKFLDYYLPTTIKLLNAYDRMDEQGISGDNIDKTKQSISEMLDTAIEAFKKQLDSLFGNQALDIETDIDVMNTMLKREGLSGGTANDFKLN